MELSEYLSVGHGRAAKLADGLKVARSRISEWANKKAPIPLRYMAPIETFTEKQVTRQEMCPDDWWNIWPELADMHIQTAPHATETVADMQPAIEHRQPAEPWDGKTERRKLDAPIDRRVSPESVAHAQFLRSQSAAKQQGL
ncbi:MAG: YdaS family helix-turn-helix protein [Burkholderiaceae bacterium]|nr:YdaS family helix-turn-helix protein [Burkholderiaceae bacterium]